MRRCEKCGAIYEPLFSDAVMDHHTCQNCVARRIISDQEFDQPHRGHIEDENDIRQVR